MMGEVVGKFSSFKAMELLSSKMKNKSPPFINNLIANLISRLVLRATLSNLRIHLKLVRTILQVDRQPKLDF